MDTQKQLILVVEDDTVLREVLVEKLSASGYDVTEAGDGDAALQKMREQKPDLILLDILMPYKGGMEVMEEMNQDSVLSHIPVVIISNSGQPIEIKRAKELGAKDFLIKAVLEPTEVVDKVRSVLADSAGVNAPKHEGTETGEGDVQLEISSEPAPAAPAAGAAAGGNGKRILVVEDDKFLRELFVRKLYSDGFDVKNAIDAKAAFEILAEEKKPDIILLDLILPGEDGFSVLGRIKKDPNLASIPVMVLSNLGQKEDIDKAMELGAIDFMVKANFTLDEIIARVKEKIGA